MKSKIMKILVAALALVSLGLMGCEPSKDAEGAVNITVKDADGNKYPTMKIGQQIWMAKNLNVKTDGSWCYDNDPANCEKYGRLYTWDAAKMACPSGWHLPSEEEMETFIEAVKLRVEQIVTPKKLNAEPLKKDENEFPKHLLDSSWDEGFNTFGFSALPAGHCYGNDKDCNDLGEDAHFWSSTEINSPAAYRLAINGSRAGGGYSDKVYGYSVRCLQD